MPIQQVVTQAQAVVDRARSLFGSPKALTPAWEQLGSAAESTAAVGQRTAGLSGELVDRHSDFVGAQTRDLSRAGRTDTTLESNLSITATVTHSGSRQLDAVVARNRMIGATAGSARTPAAQRTVLAALRSQISQANAVVTATQQQAGDVAAEIRGLNYGSGGADSTIVGGPQPGKTTIDMVNNGIPVSQDPVPPPPAPPGTAPQIGPLPVPPEVAAAAPPLTGKGLPLSKLLLPDLAPPPPFAMPNGTRAFYDELTKIISSRPPEDPAMAVARQARQMADQALHQGCTTLQWGGSGLVFVGSTGMFLTAVPAVATLNPLAIAAAIFSGTAALGSGVLLADCFAR